MKPNDKAYKEFMRVYNKTHVSLEAQIMASLTAAFAAQFPPSEDHKPLKKAWLCYRLCEGGGAYDGPFFIKYDPYEENDYDKIEPILYYDAAQFPPSEEYAEYVKRLRGHALRHTEIGKDPSNRIDWKAADALEAVVAERDALKAELAKAQEIARVQAERIGGYIKTIEDHDAERDALAARLAPVDDEALVEIAADAIDVSLPSLTWEEREGAARSAIAAIRPHIEAAERERCAKIAEAKGVEWDRGDDGCARAIAAAIRSGK